MAIGSAIQRGNAIYVYDEHGRQLCVAAGGTGPNDGLQGYTGSTFSVRRGNAIYVYDEKGRQTAVMAAR